MCAPLPACARIVVERPSIVPPPSPGANVRVESRLCGAKVVGLDFVTTFSGGNRSRKKLSGISASSEKRENQASLEERAQQAQHCLMRYLLLQYHPRLSTYFLRTMPPST